MLVLGQANSATDSLKKAYQAKKTADSLNRALIQKKAQDRRDSVLALQQKRMEEAKARRDSTAAARRVERQAALKNKREYLNNKKRREQIRDSIANESNKAAAARKALRKKLAKKKKTPEGKKIIAKQKEKAERIKQAELAKKEKEKKEKEIEATANIRKKERLAKRLEKQKTVVVTKDDYSGNNYYQYEIIRQPPEKKNTFISFQLGHSNYLGDLGGNSGYGKGSFKDVSFKENTFMYGISITHLRKEAVGLRFSYLFGNLAGGDKNTFFKNTADPSYSRYIRNLDFRTTIREASLLVEIYPFKFFSYSKKLHNSYFQPYVIGGIGLFSFNPQGSYFDDILDDDVWVDLAPLRTEGQGMAEYPERGLYKLTQMNIPLGFGFNYELNPSILTGLECNGRLLFTDYLDDVSTNFINPNLYDAYLTGDNIALAKQMNNKSDLVDATKAYKPGQIRGNPTNNDFYFTVSARLIIKLNRNKKPTIKKTQIFKFDDSEICD